MFEPIIVLMLVFLGIFAAGNIIGYHQGWQDGYWTEHPPPLTEENPDA